MSIRYGTPHPGLKLVWMEQKAYVRYLRLIINIESHLDEISWHQFHSEDLLLSAILSDTVRGHGAEENRRHLVAVENVSLSSIESKKE